MKPSRSTSLPKCSVRGCYGTGSFCEPVDRRLCHRHRKAARPDLAPFQSEARVAGEVFGRVA